MPLADYLLGLLLFVATEGAVLAAATLLVRRRLSHLKGAPRILAVGLTASAGTVGVHLVPGIAGLLSRPAVLACALLLLAAAARLPAATPGTAPPPPASEPSGAVSWIVAAAAGSAVALWTLAEAWTATVVPSTGVDTLTFHLPNIARWIQTGSFWQVDQFTPLLANGNYPHNGDVIFMAAVLPWDNDAFASLVHLPFAAMASIAVYAVARELGSVRAVAVLFAAVWAALPVGTYVLQEGTQTDTVLMAAFGAGVLFLVRHLRGAPSAELVLAGIGLGLAFGTKWYGVSSVLVVLAVWAAGSLVAGRGWRAVLRQGAALTGVVALAGGFWLVRNAVESGNPVFPVNLEVAGLTVLDAPRDYVRECAGFSVAHYLGDWDVLERYVLPAYRDNYAIAGAVLIAGLFLASGLGIALRRGLVTGLCACTGLLIAAYAVTPYTALGGEGQPALIGANARYALPALFVAAALAPWAASRLGRGRLAVELLAATAVADGIGRAFAVPAQILLPAAAAAVSVGLGWRLVRHLGRRLSPGIRRAAAVALATVAVLGVAIVGHVRQREFNDAGYRGFDPVLDRLSTAGSDGLRVGLAGVWSGDGISPVLPAFGRRLGNEVQFVGEYVDGQLREIEHRDRWAAAVRRGGYDVVLVGRGGYNDVCPVPGRDSDDDAFARAEGFPVMARSDRFTLYAIPRS